MQLSERRRAVVNRWWGLALAFSLAVSSTACGDDEEAETDAGLADTGAGDAAAEADTTPPEPRYLVPLDPESPWPKFRRNAWQTGRSDVAPVDTGGDLWMFETGKGIFSTPVIDAEGTVYVGSADRTFYAIDADGTEIWSFQTGEIIDSSALLDDAGRVIFGSGDGTVYALDRETGAVDWTFEADPPGPTGAFINWFEGNVAIGSDGTLFVPNDNFCTYALDRETGEQIWCHRTLDQTWSLPAVDPASDTLYIGNNFVTENIFALDAATGGRLWTRRAKGSVAASPMLASTDPDEGLVVVGSFDGILRGFRLDGSRVWEFGARDHIYASPAQLSDGTIVQPSADGTIYALDPADGSLRWAFDTREPIRSSPAVDAVDQIYVGSGEGRLFVLNPDGTLRWSIQLIDDRRDDLNASPALGDEAIVIAGESGAVFSVPYDYCLRDSAAEDPRCRRGPGEDLPEDGVSLLFATPFGRLPTAPPGQIAANQPLAFQLLVRTEADTVLALIDSESVTVELDPEADVIVDVSGDRKFLTIIPDPLYSGAAGGELSLRIRGDYLVNFERDGLNFTGGEVGGSFDETFTFEVQARSPATLSLPFPSVPGDDSAMWELYRLAAPWPTILPSYNQIGFDSIHYLVGVVEGTEEHAVAWAIGARLEGEANRTVVDPGSSVRFALVLSHDDGLLTMINREGFTIEFNGFPLPFNFFRVSTRVTAAGEALASPAINAKAVCGEIDFYGLFLQSLGYCNPVSDLLNVFGGAELRPHEGGVQSAPEGLGTVTIALEERDVVATLSGSSLLAADHNFGVLLVSTDSDTPVVANYVEDTVSSGDPESGAVAEVRLAVGDDVPGGEVRAYLMVDTYPAAVETLLIPPAE